MDPKDKDLPFHLLPEVVNRYLTAPAPVILNYTIKCVSDHLFLCLVLTLCFSSSNHSVDQERNVNPKVFDIPIEIEDPLKTKAHAILNSLEGPPMRDIIAAEDEVGRSPNKNEACSI